MRLAAGIARYARRRARKHEAKTAMAGKINVTHHSSLGTLWFAGWLFTIGYLKLGFWWGLLAILLWPYLIGAHFAP